MEDLASFFTQRNMAFESVGDGGISSAFATTLGDGTEQAFSLFVLRIEDGLGDRYVRFTIVPFIEQPESGYPSELYITIGQINHDIPVMKFAFDADGDLELIRDVPAAELDDEQFAAALQGLADYAGAYYRELSSLIWRGAGENRA